MEIAPSARKEAQVVHGVGRSTLVTMTGGVTPSRDSAGGRPQVLFLHGWGVGPQSYSAPIDQLRRMGCDVHAPALPGFAGAPALAGDECSFAGYARWVDRYLNDKGVNGPVVVIGHSFGGGVAVQWAHDFSHRACAVVLCNSVGAFSWDAMADHDESNGSAHERPLWAWGRFLGADLLALPSLTRILPALLGTVVPNLITNPLAMWRVAEFVRHADLVGEAQRLSRGGVPMTIVWSDRDRVVPGSGFSTLCRAAGVEGVVVPGTHSWLVASPGLFADVVWRALVEAGVAGFPLAVAV